MILAKHFKISNRAGENMRHLLSLASLLMLALSLLSATPAHAQATRTWVSGVGDDANPCSRTAPCQTFAGAISKTAAGGEIDCLDPGGFGTVTITKAMTIDCQGTMGTILASATNGININAGASDVVVLRNLSINGAGTTIGLNGINILAGKTVHIEKVKVFNFSQSGIVDARSTQNGFLSVIDTVAHDITGAGLAISNVNGSSNLSAVIDNFRSISNGYGIAMTTSINATIKNSALSNSVNAGIDNEGALIIANDNLITGNTTGVLNQSGITRLSNNDMGTNTTAVRNNSGYVVTYGNNRNPGPNVGTITPAGSATSDLGQQ